MNKVVETLMEFIDSVKSDDQRAIAQFTTGFENVDLGTTQFSTAPISNKVIVLPTGSSNNLIPTLRVINVEVRGRDIISANYQVTELLGH